MLYGLGPCDILRERKKIQCPTRKKLHLLCRSVVMQAAPLIQGIIPPKPLDITTNITENWKQFKQIWENYDIITNLTAQTEQYRVALFLQCRGPDAMKIYTGLQFANEAKGQKCNGRNHFATVCKKGQARGVHGLSEQPELDGDERDDSYESSDYEFPAVIVVEPSIHAIEQTSGYAREIYAEMMINNKKIKF